MFLGGASICRGSEACRTKVHPLKLGADLTAAVMLAGVLGGWLLGRRGSTGQSDTGQDGIFYGDRVGMTFDDGRVETMDISEERRVGKESVSTCGYRGSPSL